VSIEFAPKSKESRILFVLISLLIMHLVLISLQVEDSGGTILLKRWALTVEAPFLNLFSSISSGAREFWTDYVWLQGAREENRQLKEAIQQLKLRDAVLMEARQENARLRALLDFKEGFSGDILGARVVGRTPAYLSNIMLIDRGARDGVQVDMPVVTGEGILGRVILVAANNSQVQLISNADASVGVVVERTRSPGVLRGTGDRLLSLLYIANSDPVEEGDMILTSGLDGIFPKGMPVGRVVESQKGKLVTREIQVEPIADLLRIEEVLILQSPVK
jgi:rod shape-determining protein MreC